MPSSPWRWTPLGLFAPPTESFLGPEPDLDELRGVVEGLQRDPEVLRGFLAGLLADDGALAVAATRSGVHANGFAKIVLHVRNECSVRLHVWHRRNGRWVPDTMPHGHRWEFASWILVGALLENIFVESADGVPHERFAYGRRPDGEPYLRPIGPARLQTVDTLVHRAGSVYTRSRSMIHTATPNGDGLVATVILQGPRQFEPTPVYVHGGDPDPEEWALPVDRLRELLAEVVETLP